MDMWAGIIKEAKEYLRDSIEQHSEADTLVLVAEAAYECTPDSGPRLLELFASMNAFAWVYEEPAYWPERPVKLYSPFEGMKMVVFDKLRGILIGYAEALKGENNGK